ncbi:MAG: exodeoxyribonuclease VII small subunit [Eubacteriaceae bacterium]|nr:exodeoxyribonuclease VII small subunit [Eubacteriaceae bacterium]
MAKEPFEKQIERIEKITADLESGELSLEESMRRYEEGVKLIAACGKSLMKAEGKVTKLMENLEIPFEGEKNV